MPMYTIRLASSSDGRSGGGPIRTPSTCVTPLAAAMRSSEAPSPAEPVRVRRDAGVNAAAAIVSIIIAAPLVLPSASVLRLRAVLALGGLQGWVAVCPPLGMIDQLTQLQPDSDSSNTLFLGFHHTK